VTFADSAAAVAALSCFHRVRCQAQTPWHRVIRAQRIRWP
jgi:alkylated DNA nucleotide flippase Atl1